MLGAVDRDQHRMQSPCWAAARIALAHCCYGDKIVAADCGNNLGADPPSLGAGIFRITVGVELGRVEVAMGVNQHRVLKNSHAKVSKEGNKFTTFKA